MRIFKWVFGGLLVATILLVAMWVAREKITLAVAGYKLRNDVARLKEIAFRSDSYGLCDSGKSGYQLRFISEVDYVIEPVCDEGDEVKPIAEGKLAGGVRRLYGSGIYIKMVKGVPVVEDAWVHLIYHQNRMVVGLFDGLAKVVWKNVDNFTIGGQSPAWGSCHDWGFSCCVTGVEQGEGASVRTYDCANNCYQRCNRLPVVMFFNSEPLLNPKTRTLVVSKSNPVVKFGLEVSDDQGLEELKVDFGDGEVSPLLSAKTADLAHEYKCAQAECRFVATVFAEDQAGNKLVESSLNQMVVIVR